jgi:hypothetical protein
MSADKKKKIPAGKPVKRTAPYPWNLTKRSPATRFSLAVIGNMNFGTLYGAEMRSVLRACRRRVASAMEDAEDYLSRTELRKLLKGDTTADRVALYQNCIDAVAKSLPSGVSSGDLCTIRNHSWPGGLHRCLKHLHKLGFTFTVHLIPDYDKLAIKDFLDPAGGNFVARIAGLNWEDFFTLPGSAFTGDELDALFWGRRYGIMLCHPSTRPTPKSKRHLLSPSFSNPIYDQMYMSESNVGNDIDAPRDDDKNNWTDQDKIDVAFRDDSEIANVMVPSECWHESNNKCQSGSGICVEGGLPGDIC